VYRSHFTIHFSGKNWRDKFWKTIQDNSESHFFLDEVPNVVGPDELNLLSEKVAKNKYLWAACQSHLPPSKMALKGKLIQL
jgi:hypothetical protein